MNMYVLKNNFFKLLMKILSVFLSIVMIIGIIPSFAYAGEIAEEMVEDIQEEKYILSEVEDLRDEYTKTYLMSDRTMQVVQYSQPVHYQKDDEWYEYDLSLFLENGQTADDFDGYKSESPNFNVKFADSIYSDTLVSIDTDKYSLKWSINDVSKVRSFISDVEIASEKAVADETEELTVENAKDSITYLNFRKNSDLNYRINPNGIKENIILNEKADSYEYHYTIETVGLSMDLDEAGNILCNDISNGDIVFFIPHAYMYDAVFEVSTEVEYTLNRIDDNQYEFVITANDKWINDENRQFPITVDPQIEVNKNNEGLTICNISSTKSTSDLIKDENMFLLGCPNLEYGNCSALLKFSLPRLDAKSTIVSSQLILQENSVVRNFNSQNKYQMQINAYTIETAWSELTDSWTRPLHDLTVLDYAMVSTDDMNTIMNGYAVPKVFDITKAIESWYNGNTNWGILLEAKDNIREYLGASFFYDSQNGAGTQPMLIINYRTNTGIEPYWTFTEMSNGDSDTAYVNNYNGNLIYSHTDVSTTGNKFPVEIKHIYNKSDLRNVHRIGPAVGENWKLNIQQTVRYASFYGLSGETAQKYPYIYEDGDGTPHYFYKKVTGSKVELLDEDGLGLELKIINDSNGKRYTITDKSNTVMTFNDFGNLIKYEDCQKLSNSMNITHKRVVIEDIAYDVITQVTDGAGHIIKFNYNSEDDIVLRSISDEKGNKIYYTYDDKEEQLKKIRNTNGKTYTLSYTDLFHSLEQVIDEENSRYIYIQYSATLFSQKLKGLHLAKRNGQYIDFLKKDDIAHGYFFNWKSNETIVSSSDKGGINYIYQFDSAGRTISVNSYSGNEDYGAAIYDYTASSNSNSADDIKQRNKIAGNASLGRNTYNLINNIGAEFSGGWSHSAVNNAQYTASYDSSVKYEGGKSFKINCTAGGNDGRARLYQDFNSDSFIPGQTYTLSSYVKTSNLRQVSSNYSYSGAGVLVTAYDENNKGLTNFQSEYISGTTDYGENGWTRIYTTFTAPENAALLRVNLIVRNATGIAYFDNVQFEKSDTPSPVNLIENSNFKRVSSNNAEVPDKWFISSDVDGGYGITEETNEKYNSFYFSGDTQKNKMLMADVYVSSDENDTYIVSGWAKGNAVPGVVTNEDSDFNISVKIHYSDGSSAYKPDIAFNKYESDWQYTAGAFSLDDGTSAKKTPVYITVFLRLKKQANTASFKNIQVIKADADSYVYDSNGNAINASNSAAQNLSNTFSGSDLIKSVDKNGYVTEFKYDNYHNVTQSTTQNGIETNYRYNDSGQVTSTETICSDNFLVLKTETEYTEADEEKGIAAGAYVKRTYDENGNAVNYDYDLRSGNLNQVTNQNGIATDYTYDSKTNRLKSTSSSGVTESYSYNKGNLSAIHRAGADGKSLGYSMTYSNFGYLTSTKVGNQLLSSNTYNEKNGNMLQTVYGNGDKVNYAYDSRGNVTSVKENDALTNISVYNNRGLLMFDKDYANSLSTDYGYDTINRVTSKKVHAIDSQQPVFATEYTYDINSQITRIVNAVGSRKYYQNYEYGKDSRLSKYTFGANKAVDYEYDSLGRLSAKNLNISADIVLPAEYHYKDAQRFQPVMECYTTKNIGTEILNQHAYSYEYDSLGNIIRISEKAQGDIGNPKEVVSYEYDDLNQLIRENNKSLNQTVTYEYDSGGNLLNKRIYPLTADEITGNPTEIVTYAYENSNWCDQLTAYNGQQISYDEIGNPTDYLGYTMHWFGRQLNSLNGNGLNVSYCYDQGGTRIAKTVNGTKYTYQYDGGKLFYEKRNRAEFYYLYDGAGNLTSIIHYDGNGNRAQYYVLCNSRGDVVDIYNQDGTPAAHYVYDSWGNTASVLDNNGNEITAANHIGILNQIRYRGYYLDAETGYYYLMSRYYNSTVGRFLNADGYLMASDTVLSTNMYAYCENSPVIYLDSNGLVKTKKYGELSKGWKYRIDSENDGTRTNRHIKIWKGKDSYSQNDDGSPHDGSSGKPPKHIRNELKEDGIWDWDANESKLKENNQDFSFSFDFNQVSDVLIFTLLIIICVPIGIFLSVIIFKVLKEIWPVFMFA